MKREGTQVYQEPVQALLNAASNGLKGLQSWLLLEQGASASAMQRTKEIHDLMMDACGDKVRTVCSKRCSPGCRARQATPEARHSWRDRSSALRTSLRRRCCARTTRETPIACVT
eukprot:3443629-Prymnesium_polylepis.1